MDVTARALDAGIAAAVVGNKIGDISAAIGDIAHAAGLSVNTDFGGHGVGRVMHGDPHIPNDGRRKRGLPLRAGLVFAIEPWFMLGTDEIYTDPDGWTLRSRDGSRGAHFEHTIAVTDDGPDRAQRALGRGQPAPAECASPGPGSSRSARPARAAIHSGRNHSSQWPKPALMPVVAP